MKGISLRRQKTGELFEGPLGPAFKEFSREKRIPPVGQGALSGGHARPVSPAGRDLARIYARRGLWVLFADTGGSGIAPWRGLIILDSSYQDEGQVETPAALAMVAHELTHLLQREFNQPHYWPGGGLRPARSRRWIGDSTNYMEMLAYLVSWTIEHDYASNRMTSSSISEEERRDFESNLADIRAGIADFTQIDSQKAIQMLCDLFPENPIYRQNLKVERRYPDHRIPPGAWHSWLLQMGFSRRTIDHILVLAAQTSKSETRHSNL